MNSIIINKTSVSLLVLTVSTAILLVKIEQLNYFTLALLITGSLFLGAWSTFSAVKGKMERLNSLVLKDKATGLYDATVLPRLLDYDIKRSERYERPLALMLIDVDHFSVFQQEYGNKFADVLLGKISSILIDGAEYYNETKKEFHGIRISDLAFRFEKQDKLAVIMPETDTKGAQIAAERFREAIMFSRFKSTTTEPLSLTISAAVVSYQQGSEDSAEDLLVRAELLLKKSKITKNHIAIQNPINNDLFAMTK
ncbi:MAG: diguanylate cyclase [Thiotrichaceae bacterium]|nr:diguanylate cyclase [Thiotrichaceae bacterium]